jgi:antirestriction protein
MKAVQNETPRIYVACLAAYNNGKLHGEWIDANQDDNAIFDDIKKILSTSPEPLAEEWAIHDYEGFHGVRIREYENIGTVSQIAQFIEEHGKIGAKILSYYGNDLEEAKTAIEEQYRGCYKSLEDFAQELYEECYEIPEHLQNYIDYQAIARDMELSGDVFTLETQFDEVHVFWSR